MKISDLPDNGLPRRTVDGNPITGASMPILFELSGVLLAAGVFVQNANKSLPI